MRVLLALDGSASADAARLAVSGLPWPDGSVIHVLGVSELQRVVPLGMGPMAPPLEVPQEEPSPEVAGVVAAAAASLARATCFVDEQVVVGRPASVIVTAAERLGVELIVLGSRGRGPLTSMLLGSVSAEVVGAAPCAVLVVRRFLDGPVLVATDGSRSADAAISYLVGHRLFLDRSVDVLTVAPRPPRAPDAETGDAAPVTGGAEVPARWRDWAAAEDVATLAAARLRRAGYQARSTLAVGDPAHRIIEAATDHGSGLIVTGSRGLTGLRRLMLGSVARNVLLHTPTSVLVVHEPIREPSAELARLSRERPAGAPLPA
jgi:nucleotide-binding universal stress UspA family protein